MTTMSTHQSGNTQGNGDLLARGVARLVIAGVFLGVLLFWGAGTLTWPRGWLFLALMLGTLVVNLSVMFTKSPALLRERWKRQEGTKGFDKLFGVAYFLLILVFLTLAGIDSVRLRWTEMAESLIYVGAALHLLGTVPVIWSLLANPHLETTVRIQTDRGHRVISDGPYRFVRHPMYIGMILMLSGWPLVLGSWVAFGVALLIIGLFLVRTALEDRTLKEELEGYTDYCSRTRFRLVPGLW